MNLSDCEKVFDRLSKTCNNWNTYGSDAPSAESVEVARDFVAMACRRDCFPYRIAASAEEGITVTFASEDRSCFIEFYNDKSIAILYLEDDSTVDADDVSDDWTEGFDQSDLLNKILEFLRSPRGN